MVEITTLQQLVGLLATYDANVALVLVGQTTTDVVSFAQLAKRALLVSEDLRRRGVEQGEPVAIFAPNSSAWIATCLGILTAGAAVMPLDAKQGESERERFLARNQCRLLYIESDKALPVLSLRVLREELASKPTGATDPVLPAASSEDMALLLHTSGTTATPKAVPLTHANILSNIKAVGSILQLGAGERALLPLPLHHAYPLVVGLLLPLSRGATVVLPSGISGPELSRALQVGGSNWLIGVPRLYDALSSTISRNVQLRGNISARVFDRLSALSTALAQNGQPTFGRMVFARVRRTIAPGLRRLASGGAALDSVTERMLVGLGYEVLVGYGLTETSPIVSFNRPGHTRIGSAGQTLPGVKVRLAGANAQEIGEIEVRGPNVFAGYRSDPAATREAFTTGGWFRTRDLGRIDARGYLYLHGRSTETLVLAGGEKLNPEVVEAGYKNPLIDEIAVLVVDGKLVGLVVPSLLARTNRDEQSCESAIRAAISARGNELQSYMRLTGFASVDTPLPRTELGKLQRHLLPALYRTARLRAQGRGIEPVELPSSDRALLQEPTAQRMWSWLQARFPDQRLSLDMSPQLDLGVDSLGWIALTMEIEHALGITLDESALAQINTLRDLIKAAIAAKPALRTAGPASTWLEPPNTFARIVYFTGHTINRALVRLFFPLAVEGVEHLPELGPYVLCANHASYLDAPVLAAALPWFVLRQLYFAGSVNVMFSAPWRRLFSRYARVLPIDSTHGARTGLALSAQTLERGHVLAWFPEGWLSRDGTLQPFLPGIGSLMLQAPVPIIPVYIDGTFASLSAQRRIPRRCRLTVRFGARLDPQRWMALTDRENAAESIAAAIKAAVSELAPEGRMLAGKPRR
jgi:long-chain acyl-CoA synthetase